MKNLIEIAVFIRKVFCSQKTISFSISFVLFHLLLAPHFLSGQVDFNKIEFQLYKMNEGLPANKITSIIQDKRGYIWIGTDGGISRFDGALFESFTRNDKQIKLFNDDTYKLINLTDSLLGIVTQQGCHVINTFNMKSVALRVNDSTEISALLNEAHELVRLKNGNYIVVTSTGIHEYNSKGKLIFRHDFLNAKNVQEEQYAWEKKSAFLIDGNKLAVYAYKKLIILDTYTHKYFNSNTLKPFALAKDDWEAGNAFAIKQVIRKQIGSDEFIFLKIKSDSLVYYNKVKNILRNINLPKKISSNILYTDNHIFDIGNKQFAIPSFSGGFYVFEITEDFQIKFNETKYLPGSDCICVFRDSENRLWVGTSNGLLKQKDLNSPIHSYPLIDTLQNATLNNKIFVMNDKIFITTNVIDYKNFLTVLDLKTKQVIKKMPLPSNKRWGLAYDLNSYYKDTLWVSTTEGIMWINVNNFNQGIVKLPVEIRVVPFTMGDKNSDGEAWMHSTIRMWHIRYNAKKRTFVYYNFATKIKPFLEKPLGLVYDSYGDVWFYGMGLERWNKKKQCFDTLITDFGKKGGFENYFPFVTSDNKGGLWVYHDVNGFIRYDIKSKKIETIDMGLNVPIKHYNSFSKINNNILWSGHADMLVNYNINKKKSISFNQNEGVPDGVFTSLIYLNPETNECFVCMDKKLISFSNIPNDPAKKKILVDYIYSGNNKTIYSPADTTRLNYNENTLTIKFNILDFGIKYPRKFVYQIDNQGEWNNISQTQPIFLYNLATGWHDIIIKSLNNQDKFDEKKIAIYIHPPFWKTTWFVSTLSTIILAIFFFIIRFFFKRIKRQNNLQLQLKEFELKALHAQMNPHFIFNCLNSIKALIINNKNTEASKYINGFSKLVRLNLEHSRKPFISLKENIEYINLYVASEKSRFTNFTYNFSSDPSLDVEDIYVVPMLIQPIVENAIWHGLQQIEGERILNIKYEKGVFGARCIIEDNGIGINKSLELNKNKNTKSVGMDNIKERITLFNQSYKLNYKIEVIDKSEFDPNTSGTIVIIHFDLQ